MANDEFDLTPPSRSPISSDTDEEYDYTAGFKPFDFNMLPDLVAVEIFKYLPLNERVRIGRVSRRFRQFAFASVSRTKFLQLNNRAYIRMNGDQLSRILDSCRQCVERIQFPSRIGVFNTWNFKSNLELQGVWAVEISKRTFPNLVDLNLGSVRVESDVLESLVGRNEKLRTLISSATPRLVVYSDDSIHYPLFKSRSLETLRVVFNANSRYYHRLRGHLPKLKTLDIELVRFSNGIIFNDIFDVCPNVEAFQLQTTECSFVLATIDKFWRLSKLRVLRILNKRLDDADLEKIVSSFKSLERLDLTLSNVTNSNLASLAELKKLRELQLLLRGGATSYNDGICKLVECDQLESAVFDMANVIQGTIVLFFQYCPRLVYLRVRQIIDVVSAEDGARLVRKLGTAKKRKIVLVVTKPDDAWIWKSPMVEKESKRIEAENGPMITIRDKP